MEYPVYINGKKTGVLSVRRDGLMTAFEADCEYAEGLLRLWVYGDGEPLPLGVLRPEGGRLRLKKRFTKNELRRFSGNITCAGDKAPQPEPEKEPETSPKPEEQQLLWVQTPKGTLMAYDGERTLLAMPTLGRMSRGRTLMIGGRRYMVFESKRNLR